MRRQKWLWPHPDFQLGAWLWLGITVYIAFDMLRSGLWHGPLLFFQLGMLAGSLLLTSGYWLGQWWARWFCMGLMGTFAIVNTSLDVARDRFSVWTLGFLGLCIWAIYNEWTDVPAPQSSDDDEPSFSLAMLLREPLMLNNAVLAHIASRAWGLDIRATKEDGDESAVEEGDGWVVGSSPITMIYRGDGMFLLTSLPGSYFGDATEEVAAGCPERRIRTAISEHNASLNMAAMGVDAADPAQVTSAYRAIGLFLAELASAHQCLAIIDPGEGRIYPYDPETQEKLRSDDPIAALRHDYYAPVVEMSDEEVAAAIELARERWSEFVAAFDSRTIDVESTFIVKAPFSENDNTEHMWVEVTAIEGDFVYGTLQNHPHQLPSLRLGDRVRFPAAELSDWLFRNGEEVQGGFTLKPIAEKMNPPKASEDPETA